MIDKSTVGAMLLMGASEIIAQLGDKSVDIPGVTDVANITATGAIIWYCWYTTTRTIPNLVKDFRDEMAMVRADRDKERDAVKCLHRADPGQSIH